MYAGDLNNDRGLYAKNIKYLYQTERVGNPLDVGGEMDIEHESVSAD